MNTLLLATIDKYAPTISQRVIPAAVALIIILTTVELIRRRKLREEYAMIWLLASGILAVFAIYPKLLILISEWMGVNYLTTLFLGVFLFLMLLALGLAMSVSRLTDDLRQTAQRVALLERDIEQATGRGIGETDQAYAEASSSEASSSDDTQRLS